MLSGADGGNPKSPMWTAGTHDMKILHSANPKARYRKRLTGRVVAVCAGLTVLVILALFLMTVCGIPSGSGYVGQRGNDEDDTLDRTEQPTTQNPPAKLQSNKQTNRTSTIPAYIRTNQPKHVRRYDNNLPLDPLINNVKTPSSAAIAEARRQGPLPALGRDSAPWNSGWDNRIAMCVAIREENTTDVREWLTYHKWLGMDHVYLTENGSPKPIKDNIQDFIDSGFVSYTFLDGGQAQMEVYRACLREHRSKWNWLAFFDADEFLHLRERGSTLKQVLDDYKFFPGLLVHWIFVGPSGMETRPKEGGVLRSYTQCNPKPDFHIKAIANTFYVENISTHPHNMVYRGQAIPVNEQYVHFEYTYGLDPELCRDKFATPGCPLSAASKLGPTKIDLASIQRLALFHFATRSTEDFERKQMRSGGTNPHGKPWSFFYHHKSLQRQDPLCEELSLVADECCPTEGYSYQAKEVV